MCDGINDCANGFDETLDNCFSEQAQLRFSEEGNISFCSFLFTSKSYYNFFLHFPVPFFNLTVLPSAQFTVYNQYEQVAEFEGPDGCPCTVELERTPIMSIEADAADFKGFIVYEITTPPTRGAEQLS